MGESPGTAPAVTCWFVKNRKTAVYRTVRAAV